MGRTGCCAAEDSALCHARKPAARIDDVVKDFSGNIVVTIPGKLVDSLAREPGASYTEIILFTKV